MKITLATSAERMRRVFRPDGFLVVVSYAHLATKAIWW